MISVQPGRSLRTTVMTYGNDDVRLLGDWVAWMQAGGLAKRTIEARRQVLGQFAVRLTKDPQDADWQEVAAFVSTDGWSAATRSTYFLHVRAYYRWLVRMEHRLDDPTVKLRSPRRPKGEPQPVTEDQLRDVLESRIHRRTRAMITLAAWQGLRCCEIARVRADDIVGGRLRVVGKGGKRVSVPLHGRVTAMQALMPAKGWWFPAADGEGPMSAKSVSAVVTLALRRAGVDSTAHKLRHRFGTQALRSAGGNVFTAQRALRHESAATTAIYAAINDDQVEAAVLGLPDIVRRVLAAGAPMSGAA